eukprot:440528-Prorocentrum_minimum.AAC.1
MPNSQSQSSPVQEHIIMRGDDKISTDDGREFTLEVANSLSKGANSLSEGENSISNGVNSLSNGANSLSKGANSLSKGAN